MDIIMFTLVLTNEFMKYCINLTQEDGKIYIDMNHVDFVNNRLLDLNYDNQNRNYIDLQDIYKDRYTTEYLSYLLDDVWYEAWY